MRYLTPAEFLSFYDKRRILKLLSDTGTAAMEGDIASNSIVLTALNAASAELDTALQVGGIYTRASIENIISLAGTITDSTAEAKRALPIKRLVADLAFYRLITRRGYSAKAARDLAPEYEGAVQMLQELSSGRRILDLDANIGAGKPTSVKIGQRAPVNPLTSNRLFGVWDRDTLRGLNPTSFSGGY